MAVKDTYSQSQDDGLQLPAGAISARAQSCTAQYTYDCRAIRLKLYRVGSPGNLTLELHENVGYPTGLASGSKTVDIDSITTSTSGEWVTFDFGEGSEVSISSSTQYWIRIDTPSAGDTSNYVCWIRDSSNGFGNGSPAYYYGAWAGGTGDFFFEMWDSLPDEGGAPTKATNPTPANSATEVDFSAFGLSWEDGGNADTYDVYIGDTGSLTKVSTAQAGTTYTTNLSEIETAIGSSPIEQKIYWRVDSTNDEGTTTGDEWNFDPRPGQASSPSPATAATDQAIYLTLTWTVGTNATTETLTGGETGNLSELESGMEAQEYVWNDLNGSTEHQWRIDSVNQFGTTTGTVWSFTTLGFAPPLPTWENLSGKTLGPLTGGTEGVDFRYLGTNNLSTVKRLVCAAASAIYYEDR